MVTVKKAKPLSKKKQLKLNEALLKIQIEYQKKAAGLLVKKKKSKEYLIPRGVNFSAQVYGFYLMQEWQAQLLNFSWSLPSQIRWKENLDRIQEEQAAQFALSLRNYIALATFGEARYGKNFKKRNGTLIRDSVKGCYTRDGCYHQAVQYAVVPLLQDLERYFYRENNFIGNTGGTPWAKACHYALQYSHVTNVQFVDMVVDLRHHSDYLFNKPCIFMAVHSPITHGVNNKKNTLHFSPIRAIQRKANGAIWYLEGSFSILLPIEVYQLAERGINLQILPETKCSLFFEREKSVFQEIPWGTKRLGEEYTGKEK